uniref:Dehydroascorbate reductase 2 n=1 Tax=Tanacetum cinerariifolium TaxID=118510 RepID=A0A6L2KXL0_TANCI|nr:dehydroascorbate reductase 2 [Tanacetum cinerariifolium]
MESNKSPMFKEQAEAIELYCSKKIESHPENRVDVSGLSEAHVYYRVYPTKDLSKIMDAVYDARVGGHLMLKKAVSYAYSIWFGKSDDIYKQKRLVLFAGGGEVEPESTMLLSLWKVMAFSSCVAPELLPSDMLSLIDVYVPSMSCVAPELLLSDVLSLVTLYVPFTYGDSPPLP